MSKKLVFTSAGDNSNFYKLWKGDKQEYDIYVVYYGSSDTIYNTYKEHATWIERRKGSKFQNFHYFYNRYPEIIERYEQFFIMDDDIIIGVNDINTMFSISTEYNLAICQPSFHKTSIAYHPVTRHIEGLKLQYTNFVEVNTPLFSKEALTKFMKYYDGSVIGAGIDFLYIWANGRYEKKKFAVIHNVTCINPTTATKGIQKRELLVTLEENGNKRWNDWEKLANAIRCPPIFVLTSWGNVSLSGEFEEQHSS